MVDGGRKEGRSQKTFRNGSGSDVEVYLRAENKAFLFRQSFTPSDDGHQADGFFGWRLLGDPILNEYTIVMRYQYFMRADDELRYVSYLAELETEGEKAVIHDGFPDGQIFVTMPTIEISSQFQTKNERFRVPSPVVRALFGEPPVQLNFKA